jgi:hypothetical protein
MLINGDCNERTSLLSRDRFTFIDLFAGCGGLSLGLLNAGWQGVFAIEKNFNASKTLMHNLVEKSNHNKKKNILKWPDWLDKAPYKVETLVEKYQEHLMEMSWFSGNRTFADFFKIVRSERTHSFKVRFLRHWQSIDPMVQEGREGVCFPPQAHRFDELHRVIPWKVARQQRLLLLLPVTSA